MNQKIDSIMEDLQKRGKFKNPDEVDDFFLESLKKTYIDGGICAINMIAQEQGWEESEEFFIDMWNNNNKK